TFAADSKIEMEKNHSVKITTQTYIKNFCQIRVHTVETEQELMAVREGGFALNYFDDVPEAVVYDKSIGFWIDNRGSFIKSLWGFSSPEKIERIMANTKNFNTLSGFSMAPTLIGGRLKPGKHVFISLSGTWFGAKDKIEELLKIINNVEINQSYVKVIFVDGSFYQFDI
ncbi:MAG: hypothetical protein JSW07_09930, partial [bacterium]